MYFSQGTLKVLGTYWNKLWLLTPFKTFWAIKDPKTMNKWHQKFHTGIFTGHLTGLFTLLRRSLTDVSLSLFHIIPVCSLTFNKVSMHWKRLRNPEKHSYFSYSSRYTNAELKYLHMFVLKGKWYSKNSAFWIPKTSWVIRP